MPAITTQSARTQLSELLRDVLNTEQNQWKKFYNPSQIKLIFSQLAAQVQQHNFFYVDYSISTFWDFLREFVQSDTKTYIDDPILKNINEIFFEVKNTILTKDEFTKQQIEPVVNFLQFINVFLRETNKNLLENSRLTFKIEDLSEITTHIVKKRELDAYIRNLISSFIATLESSLYVDKFSLNYLQEDFFSKEVVELAKLIYSQQDSQALFTIPHFFSALAYEANFIARSMERLSINPKEIEQRQEKIILTVKNLQEFFFYNFNAKHNIPREGLRYLFFKYFLQEATEIKDTLMNRYKPYFDYYSTKDFTPLPFSDHCPTVAPNEFVIQHAGLTSSELKVICQAKECAEHNYNQWLNRMGVNSEQLPNSNFIYHVFDQSKYDADLNYYFKYEPVSSAMYQAVVRNETQATGWAYAEGRSNGHQQWQTTAHEYTHHLNFLAFGNLPSSFNEGLAYRLILSPCIDKGFQDWLDKNYNQYSSIAILSNREFIKYNPSTLLMSYLVDSNPSLFVEILQSYRNGDGLTTEKIKELIAQDRSFPFWLSTYREKCKNSAFGKLGEGDNYCPALLTDDLIKNNDQNSFRTTLNVPLSTSTLHNNAGPTFLTTSQHTPDEMGYELILKISERKFDEFRMLLENGANANYSYEGNTILHFLYDYRNCDVQHLELLLKYGAKVTPNNQGQLPLQIAEKNCDAMELLKIQEAFTRHAQQQRLPLTIVMPITSFFNGTISGWSGEIAQRNSASPYIPSIIFYGLKPVCLAISNSAINIALAGSAEAIGLDDIGLSFSYYLLINYVGLMFAQFGERITNNIQNKFLNVVMPILLYTFFLNPSLLILLLNEGLTTSSFQGVLQPLLSLLSGGIFFKAGEYTAEKIYGKFFPTQETATINSNQDYFLRYSLGGSPKKISSDQQTLEKIKRKLFHLTPKIKQEIHKQVYQLNFNKDLISANESISIIIEKISHEDKELSACKTEFNDFEKYLKNIQQKLSELKQVSPKSTKIQSFLKAITDILTQLRGIRPLPLPEKAPDVLPQPEVNDEEQSKPLMSFFSNVKEGQRRICNRYTRPPTIFGKMKNIFFIRPEPESEFPDPPTQQQLLEMGIFIKENDRKPTKSGG